MNKCTYCGKEYPSGVTVCPLDGQPVVDPTAPPPPSPPKQLPSILRRNRLGIFFILGGTIGILLASIGGPIGLFGAVLWGVGLVLTGVQKRRPIWGIVLLGTFFLGPFWGPLPLVFASIVMVLVPSKRDSETLVAKEPAKEVSEPSPVVASATRFSWYQYLWIGWPIFLVILYWPERRWFGWYGATLHTISLAVSGVVALPINHSVFRKTNHPTKKYLWTGLICMAAVLFSVVIWVVIALCLAPFQK